MSEADKDYEWAEDLGAPLEGRSLRFHLQRMTGMKDVRYWWALVIGLH